jgi:hypothetical protein
MLIDGGGGGSMYAVQIESLETFQQKLTGILQGLEQDNSVMTMADGTSTFGDFPEAQGFANAYQQTKQDLINSFNEVTQLVNTMINVVGSNADRYRQTEQDIQAKFNAVLQQYGDTPLPQYTPGSSGTTYATYGSNPGTGTTTTTATTTSGTTYYPQNSGTTYATQDGSSGGPIGTGSPTGPTTYTGTGTGTGTGTDSTSGSSSSSGGAGSTSAGAA